jgi:hypothetical protein
MSTHWLVEMMFFNDSHTMLSSWSASQYILSLALFMVTNKSLFRQNSEIHNFNTRNNSNFFQVMTHPTMFHKSPAYAGVKIYNHLPSDMKDLACDMRSFKKALKNCLHVHSFYTVDEFFYV